MKKFVVGSPALLVTYGKAVNTLAGLPRRGVTVGGEDRVPLEYYPGAPGWTATMFLSTAVAADGSVACFEITDEALPFAGLSAEVDGQTVTLPTLDEAVDEDDLPDELKLALEAARNPILPF